jgi:cellulose synthase/poly-beta-1,6-N-acetylglucosamine synthase-like glycosyltransferase
MTLVYITIALLVTYSILLLYYRAGWRQTKTFLAGEQAPATRISVIVPARNEEENIGPLLESMKNQSYPAVLFEVIVIDDNSTDNTAAIAKSFSFVKLVQLQFENITAYKKKAIETGIAAASGELIVTTDADCIVPENWLKTIAAHKEQTNAVLIAAPVLMDGRHSFLQLFQSVDFMVLQGITAASVQKKIHNMCNGANLAYERKAFYEVNGFSGIDHIASGDDMLLMHKIARRYPGKTAFLLSDDAIVTTKPAGSWKEFFSQRIRWASKATHYNDIKIFSVLFLVYFFNLSLLALLVAGFWNFKLWIAFAILVLCKTIVELFFIYPVAEFYGRQRLLNYFILFQPLHILYTVIAGWLGLMGKYKWKDRRVK